MNTVIGKISEVESAATAIMDDANARKKAFAKEMEEKTAAFDARLEEETTKTISDMRAKMEVEMKAKLSEQQSQAAETIKQMEAGYEAHHTAYAKKLFSAMIKE